MNTNKKYDLCVYIGRFQPIHNGHISVMQKANEIAKKTLVLVGSANASPSPKNPFTYEDREHMIKVARQGVIVEPLDDYTYEENQWLTDVQEVVNVHMKKGDKVCLIGHSKDESSYYLKHFPQWDFVDVEYHEVIDATHIRQLYYQNKFAFIKGAVPESTLSYLQRFADTAKYHRMCDEYEYNENYKKSWAGSPFPPTFNTVDAVVIQSGHILLVQRKYAPGKDLFALPGGFIDPTESQEDAVIRELREETKIKVPVPVLRGSIVKEKTFSDPKRSERGRTFTQAYLIQLDDNQALPKVKGSDDAKHAEFVPLSQFYDMAEDMFEDHYHIVRKLLDNM